MFDLLQIAVDSSISYGAKYSDARILISKSRSISVKNGDVENFNETEKMGIGIRALVGSSWGFYSTYDLSKESLIESGKKSNKQFDDHIYISNLKISGSDEEINDFLNSKYGLLLEIESRLPDLDQVNRNLSVRRYKKTPLTLILLKLFLLP